MWLMQQSELQLTPVTLIKRTRPRGEIRNDLPTTIPRRRADSDKDPCIALIFEGENTLGKYTGICWNEEIGTE